MRTSAFILMLAFCVGPSLTQASELNCDECINHSLLKKYEHLYACEGDWKCKWESSALVYSDCLKSNKLVCKEKAVQGLSQVLGYAGPPESQGLEYYRLSFDALKSNNCNELTRDFYHDAAIVFGTICDEKYFKSALTKISGGCPNDTDSKAILNAIKLGHDSSTIKYSFTQFFEGKTKRWNSAISQCEENFVAKELPK